MKWLGYGWSAFAGLMTLAIAIAVINHFDSPRSLTASRTSRINSLAS
jgi:hypothetical protein